MRLVGRINGGLTVDKGGLAGYRQQIHLMDTPSIQVEKPPLG